MANLDWLKPPKIYTTKEKDAIIKKGIEEGRFRPTRGLWGPDGKKEGNTDGKP